MRKIIKFGQISVSSEGELVFKNFHIDCDHQYESPQEGILRMVIERLEIELTRRKIVIDEDDDTQGFMPDWANFEEGRKVGRAEAFEQIFDKVKKMPWENDTRDSLLIWLKEQNT
jgi:hypothetical protein